MTQDSTRCEGCDEEKPTTEIEMKYGGTEQLCEDCAKDSWEMMA